MLGARYLGQSRCDFLVWAPTARTVDVRVIGPDARLIGLEPAGGGYFRGEAGGVEPGSRYFYRLDGSREHPDPASRCQPDGVHGPSAIVAADFTWTDDAWRGLALDELVIYELHVGTFTPEGTFEGVVGRLDELRDLGITAIELMPVAQFPGTRNWGYDGAYPFAVQVSYGGPEGLKRLVDAAHARGLAVILDVVYNHLGPEGNYLERFGPYFTDRYETPWGRAVNFDGEGGGEVRRFVVENAVQWTGEFHLDALRLDAIHAIFDASPRHILAEIAEAVHRQAAGRHVHVIAESGLNDAIVVTPASEGGYGVDAQWSDDFHHALHVLLTGERGGYYQDFGSLQDLAKAYREGFVYSGQYSKYRKRRHGTSSRAVPAGRLVVCTQNHDQTGNRMLGERLNHLVGDAELTLAASALLLSPYVPLLFMGQEYGERAPFLYFVSHSDPPLIEAVRAGRRDEFKAFAWKGEVPDPQAEATFLQSRLDHRLKQLPRHRAILGLYRELLRLRRALPALAGLDKQRCEVTCHETTDALAIRRWAAGSQALTVLHFGARDRTIELRAPAGTWRKAFDSADTRWLGRGGTVPDEVRSTGSLSLVMPPRSACLLVGEDLPDDPPSRRGSSRPRHAGPPRAAARPSRRSP